VHAPYRQPAYGHQLAIEHRAYNMLLRSLRCIGESGFAMMTRRWQALQHVTACPYKISEIAKVTLVITHYEHRYQSC
jgi:hypothetical protein